jgi:hypothetical protein
MNRVWYLDVSDSWDCDGQETTCNKDVDSGFETGVRD